MSRACLLGGLELDEGTACHSVHVTSGHEGIKEDGGIPANDGGHLAQEGLEQQVVLLSIFCKATHINLCCKTRLRTLL